MNREQVLDKVVKMQAQVAGTNVEAEALAFGAAVARLMLEHDIEDADVERHRLAGTVRKEDPIVEHDVRLYQFGVKGSSKRNAALEDLVMFVGKAHLCKMLVRPGSNWVGLVGTQAHCDVAELVIGTMWRSLQKMAAHGLRQAKRDGADIRNYTRQFRHAFVMRLGLRYQEEQRAILAEQDAAQAMREAATTMDGSELGEEPALRQPSQALMVVNRELERVGGYIKDHYKRGHARSIGGRGGYNSRAQSDGHAAANRVPLRSNAVGAGTQRALGA